MKLFADYHTHTRFSHGRGTILENAIVAKEKKLKEIGITDHGFSHIAFGMRRRKLAKMKLEASMAQFKTGVNVLLGTEANLYSLDGQIDCNLKDELQIIIAGFHKFVKTRRGDWFKLCFSNICREFFMGKKRYHSADIRKKWVIRNTKSLCLAMKKNRIDIISHPNRHFRVNVLEVAKVCEQTKTAFELNNKNLGCSLDELKSVVEKTNCNFVINSDAHKPELVGDCNKVMSLIKGIVPKERILNIDGKRFSRKQWF